MNIFAELSRGLTSRSASETREIGRRVAAALPPDQTLALHGDLGVGKTTFVQGLALGCGVEDAVTSPTFNIFTLHRGTRYSLLHLDAYRLETSAQMDDLMIEDFLQSPYCLAVEWPEKIAEWLPHGTRHLRLGILEPGVHVIHEYRPTRR